MSTDFAHKNILVLGAGVTGKSVARFLQSRGAQITLTDDNSEGAVKPSEVNLKDFEAVLPQGKNEFADVDFVFLHVLRVLGGWVLRAHII